MCLQSRWPLTWTDSPKYPFFGSSELPVDWCLSSKGCFPALPSRLWARALHSWLLKPQNCLLSYTGSYSLESVPSPSLIYHLLQGALVVCASASGCFEFRAPALRWLNSAASPDWDWRGIFQAGERQFCYSGAIKKHQHLHPSNT